MGIQAKAPRGKTLYMVIQTKASRGMNSNMLIQVKEPKGKKLYLMIQAKAFRGIN